MALDPADFGPGLGQQTPKLETGPKMGGPQLSPDVNESLKKRRREQLKSLFGSALKRAVPGGTRK